MLSHKLIKNIVSLKKKSQINKKTFTLVLSSPVTNCF
jgi:hypothetical protein